MLRGNLAIKKIKKDTDNFSLEGMIEPTFYNNGAENVQILHVVVKPGEKFFGGALNMVMNNEIPIRFEGNNKSGRNLICLYVSPVSDC